MRFTVAAPFLDFVRDKLGGMVRFAPLAGAVDPGERVLVTMRVDLGPGLVERLLDFLDGRRGQPEKEVDDAAKGENPPKEGEKDSRKGVRGSQAREKASRQEEEAENSVPEKEEPQVELDEQTETRVSYCKRFGIPSAPGEPLLELVEMFVPVLASTGETLVFRPRFVLRGPVVSLASREESETGGPERSTLTVDFGK